MSEMIKTAVDFTFHKSIIHVYFYFYYVDRVILLCTIFFKEKLKEFTVHVYFEGYNNRF